MMDFDDVLNIATQNKDGGNSQKRYSLQTGPPKKVPRSKGVDPSAIQALLKKRQLDAKKKELENRKQKDELLAKRVEMKSDRKARAMASRTKDNFHGYNGVPFVEPPKKRRSKGDHEEDNATGNDGFRNYAGDPEDDEDNYEYDPSDSEPEPEPVRRPGKPSVRKPNMAQKSATPGMNFADLLKLAEKKQFEPVDLKPKAAKNEGRLRTADEIRDYEMEQKARRRETDPKIERDNRSSSSSSVRKGNIDKDQKNVKPQKSSLERSGTVKKSSSTHTSDRSQVSSKSSSKDRDREGPKMRQGDKERPKLSSSSGGMAKVPLKTSLSQVPAKQSLVRTSSSGSKSSALSDLSSSKGRSANPAGTRPSSGQRSEIGSTKQPRPSQGPGTMGPKSAKGEPIRSGGSNIGPKASSSGPSRAGTSQQTRPRDPALGKSSTGKPGGSSAGRGPPGRANPGGGSVAGRPTGVAGSGPGRPMGSAGNGTARPTGVAGSGPGRPMGSAGSGPGRPLAKQGSGPGRPSGSQGPGMSRPAGSVVNGRPMGNSGPGLGRSKCTVMSETISSKNVGGSRPGGPLRPGMQQRPIMGSRPGGPPGPMIRPPGHMLPPITSAYKRKFDDDEEYDSEMEDFIDDVEDNQEEVSKHIREIFGYDRNRYKEESDYALKFMESSWKDMQKEEARSLKMAVQEDLEEEKKEEEEMKRQMAKRKRRN